MKAKPLKKSGYFVTGSNFEILKFTKTQAVAFAKEQLRRNKHLGCKKLGVKDYGDFYAYTIW